MKSYILYVVLLSVMWTSSLALKEDECEGKKKNSTEHNSQNNFKNFKFPVCVKTVQRFADTLSDDVKKDPKKIEDEFKVFCKGQKNKEQRFVRILQCTDVVFSI